MVFDTWEVIELTTITHLTDKSYLSKNLQNLWPYTNHPKRHALINNSCSAMNAEQEVVFKNDEIEANIANLFIFDYSKSYPVILLALI